MARPNPTPRWPTVLLLLASGCGGGGASTPPGGGGGGGGGGGNEELDPGKIPDLGVSEFHVTPAFGTPADGTTSVALELVLISLLGHPINGAVVELEVSGCGNLWQPLPRTDVQGRTRGTLASLAGERKTLGARTTSGGRLTVFPTRTAEFLQIPDDTFFVRTSGSDAASGRSPREAWRTLAHALERLQPGATLHVGAGSYAGPLELGLDSSGSSPLAIAGDPSGIMTGDPGEVVIEAGGSPWALRLRGARHLVLERLTLRGAALGMRIEDSADVRVLGCRPVECDLGLSIQGSEDVIVEDCRVSANRTGGLCIGDARRTRIENNLVYANFGPGLSLLAGAPDTLIRFNTFYRNEGDQLVELGTGGSGTITENILAEGGAEAIALLDGSGFESRNNLLWAHPNRSPMREAPDGNIEADPFFGDPTGPDGVLGGFGASDDDFRLEPYSPANDVGALLARDVVLGSRASLARRTTRLDDVLEWSGDDLPVTNLGFHTALPEPPFASLAKGAGRIVHAVPNDVRMRTLAWEREHPAVAAPVPGPTLEAEIVYLEQRVSPLASSEELVVAQVSTGTQGRIFVRHWDGRRWGEPALAPFHDGIPLDELADQRFDVEHEALSGRALLVLSGRDGVPVYHVLERGRWSPARAVAVGFAGRRVRALELVPRAGTNELALVLLDERRALFVMLWDGSAFGEPLLLEANTLHRPGWRPFHAAFEGRSGDLLVTWGFNVFIEETRWATLERASGRWRTGQLPNTDAVGAHVVLAADPASDRIAATFGEADLDNDVTVSVWDGNEWGETAELTLAGPIANRLLESVWLGERGIACTLFRRQGHAGSFNAALLLSSGWRVQPDVVLAGAGKAAKVRLASLPDRGQLLGALLDLEGRLFALHYDGRRFVLLNEGAPLAVGLDPAAPGRPFDAALRAAR